MFACNPMGCSPSDSSVHGISQARVLGRLLLSPPGDLPNSGIESWSLALQADSLPSELPQELRKGSVAQSYPVLALWTQLRINPLPQSQNQLPPRNTCLAFFGNLKPLNIHVSPQHCFWRNQE